MNTLENKAKFFAQYWGQKVYGWHDGTSTNFQSLNITEKEFLIIKPLSSISDEDAIACIKERLIRDAYDEDKIKFIGNVTINKSTKTIHQVYISATVKYSNFADEIQSLLLNRNMKAYTVDYLRSKGYALDWNGITVEQQIEYGWIKLKTE